MTTIQFTSTPIASDLIWNAARMTRASLVATAVGTFATLTGLLGLIVLRDPLVIPILLVGLAFLSGLFVAPFVWWSIHRRRDLVLAPMTIAADEDGISATTSTSSSRHDWSVFRRIDETDRAYLFDTGAGAVFLVSKRDVSGEAAAALRDLAARAGVPRRNAGAVRSRQITGVVIGLALTAASILSPIVLGPPR